MTEDELTIALHTAAHEGARKSGQQIDRIQDWYSRNEADLPPVLAMQLHQLLTSER